MVAVRADPSEIYPPYLFAVLRSKLVQDRIAGMHVGTLIPHFKKGDFQHLLIPVPDGDSQRYIGDTYLQMSQKIESNRHIADLGVAYIRAAVNSRISPASEKVSVSTLGRFVNGGAFTKNATGSGRLVVRIAELNSGVGPSSVYNDLEVPHDRVANSGDLLMSWSGSLDIFRWYREEAIINQHIFKVVTELYPAWLVHDRLKLVMPAFKAIAKDKATTMGHIQRGDLDDTVVAVPDRAALKELDVYLKPIWDRILLAERENVSLATLRDCLLAQLLDGSAGTGQLSEVAV